MDAIQSLNDKLNLLLKKHAALIADNKKLKTVSAKQAKIIDVLNEKLHGLEQGVAMTHVANTLSGNNEGAGMRKQIDGVIGEIDKILNTLND